MTTPPDELSALKITVGTIRDWAEETARLVSPAEAPGHAAGYGNAARDVLAILRMHRSYPGQPVRFMNPAARS